MRTKDEALIKKIKQCIEEYYAYNGYTPSIRYIAEEVGCSKSNVQRYLGHMQATGILQTGEDGYETEIMRSTDAKTISVPKLGYVPCGPLSEEYECIDGYIRLPLSFVGSASKCFILTSSENAGNVIFTKNFKEYVEQAGFEAVLCKPYDPSSKGKVEAVVKYVK